MREDSVGPDSKLTGRDRRWSWWFYPQNKIIIWTLLPLNQKHLPPPPPEIQATKEKRGCPRERTEEVNDCGEQIHRVLPSLSVLLPVCPSPSSFNVENKTK